MDAKHTGAQARQLATTVLGSVTSSGPVGWIALVACAALALAGYAIWALVAIVRMLKG
jgi:hypothetical protein